MDTLAQEWGYFLWEKETSRSHRIKLNNKSFMVWSRKEKQPNAGRRVHIENFFSFYKATKCFLTSLKNEKLNYRARKKRRKKFEPHKVL